MKFLHTADWQIGMKAIHVGDAGERVREERLKTLSKILEVAAENHTEFILVSGDLFEDNAVERILIQRVADIIAASNTLIFIIPGNHDPYTPGSVWKHPAWKSFDNIRVLTKEEPVEVAGGIIYPCPVLEKHSRKDPTAWINATKGDGIKIGMAHGTIEGINQEEPDYPIARDAVIKTNLDYLALGHWHSMATYKSNDGAIRMAYSGTPESTRFGERDSGNVLIVDIPEIGSHPVVTPVRVGSLQWKVIEGDLLKSGNLSGLREAIENIKDPNKTLLNIRIKGLLQTDERGEIDRIQEIINSRFLFGAIDISGIRPSPEDESWVANLPPGIIRDTGEKLKQFADINFPGERPNGATPEVAATALIELYRIIEEDLQ